jgi:hypothetical protein
MWIDPIVEETRRIRDEHARRFNYDLAAICADLKRFEATLPGAPFAPPENDQEDLKSLRLAQAADEHEPTIGLDELQRRLGL